jgi:hypothetical protein
MRTTALISIVATLLSVGAGPVEADWISGPIRVMRPDGTVFRIESPSVAAWWKDYRRARCVSCTGSDREAMDRAARLLYRVERALGTRFRAAPRYLILPDMFDERGWPYAWLFYPSTDRTPAYLVTQGGISGAAGRPLSWDVWYPATDRMEEMILGPADSPPQASAVTGTDTSSSASPLPWALAVAFPVALAVSAILFWLLRRRVDT